MKNVSVLCACFGEVCDFRHGSHGREARPGAMGRSPGKAFQAEGRAQTSTQGEQCGEEKQERLSW